MVPQGVTVAPCGIVFNRSTAKGFTVMTAERINRVLKSICDASVVSGVFITRIVFVGDTCTVCYHTMDTKKAYAFAKAYDEGSRDGKLGFNRNVVQYNEEDYSFTSN